MSPSWRDRVRLEIGPASLRLVRRRAGWRPRSDAPIAPAVTGEQGIAAALSLLDATLAERAWRGAEVDAVVSGHWTRAVVMPWTPGLVRADEREALARELLVAQFGSALAAWPLRLSALSPRLVQVAAALEPALYDGLGDVIARHGLALRSLIPRHVADFNQQRVRIAAGDAWFVSVEPGMLSATRIDRGDWQHTHGLRVGATWGGELRRLALMDGAGDLPVYGCAPDRMRRGADDVNVVWLDDATPAVDVRASA